MSASQSIHRKHSCGGEMKKWGQYCFRALTSIFNGAAKDSEMHFSTNRYIDCKNST